MTREQRAAAIESERVAAQEQQLGTPIPRRWAANTFIVAVIVTDEHGETATWQSAVSSNDPHWRDDLGQYHLAAAATAIHVYDVLHADNRKGE